MTPVAWLSAWQGSSSPALGDVCAGGMSAWQGSSSPALGDVCAGGMSAWQGSSGPALGSLCAGGMSAWHQAINMSYIDKCAALSARALALSQVSQTVESCLACSQCGGRHLGRPGGRCWCWRQVGGGSAVATAVLLRCRALWRGDGASHTVCIWPCGGVRKCRARDAVLDAPPAPCCACVRACARCHPLSEALQLSPPRPGPHPCRAHPCCLLILQECHAQGTSLRQAAHGLPLRCTRGGGEQQHQPHSQQVCVRVRVRVCARVCVCAKLGTVPEGALVHMPTREYGLAASLPRPMPSPRARSPGL